MEKIPGLGIIVSKIDDAVDDALDGGDKGEAGEKIFILGKTAIDNLKTGWIRNHAQEMYDLLQKTHKEKLTNLVLRRPPHHDAKLRQWVAHTQKEFFEPCKN